VTGWVAVAVAQRDFITPSNAAAIPMNYDARCPVTITTEQWTRSAVSPRSLHHFASLLLLNQQLCYLLHRLIMSRADHSAICETILYTGPIVLIADATYVHVI